MKVQATCRFEKEDDDAIEKISIKENIKKSAATMKIFKLGLEAYYKENKASESEKIEKNLAPKFDKLQEKMQEKFQELSTQIKDVDLKSVRMNVFLTDLAKDIFQDNDKFISFNNDVLSKLDDHKKRIKYIPPFGLIVLKYMKDISNKSAPIEFYSEIGKIYSAMINEK